ncbi:MAG TPA: HlyD family efflux transporter periplasmic adaptor subunit [Thermoanaerobaculia bacterium]|nr:HlyD family efflux transporter periplasmic adaptor subunit [Thermoanaerobaculia bacterium]
MDIKREGVAEAKRRRRIVYGVIGAAVLALVTLGLYRLEPAAPTVDRATVWLDTVKRGEMLRQVRGPGTLVPEEIRRIALSTEGVVERRLVLPGATVEADTVILELSNSELEQETQDAELALRAAEADYSDLAVRLDSQLLNDRAEAARIESEYRQALLQAEADEKLLREGLIPDITQKLSRLRADELANRNQIEAQRLEIAAQSNTKQLASRQARLEQTGALYELRKRQLEGLKVRPGIAGVLQDVPVEIGERVPAGRVLAVVAQPDHLKAELRIAETQARDVAVGQKASIDTRNGLIAGVVSRIDPAVREGTVLVDVALEGALPRGARPDLSVDGTLEIERLTDVLYVGRPAYGQANSTITLFRLERESSTAIRVPVELGRSSVSTIEIVRGLEEGDQVVLSDISQFEDYDRVRLN